MKYIKIMHLKFKLYFNLRNNNIIQRTYFRKEIKKNKITIKSSWTLSASSADVENLSTSPPVA